MSNLGAGGGPPCYFSCWEPLVLKITNSELHIFQRRLGALFFRGGCLTKHSMWWISSIHQTKFEWNMSSTWKKLWIIGQKNCETSTMRRRMCANAQHWIESGDLQKVKIFWGKYFLCRGLGTPEEWRGLDSYYYSIIIVNIIITLVTTSKRVIWDYENPLTIYIWNQQKTGTVKLACLYFL